MTILKGENLKKSYNQRVVVKGVNIEIQTGRIISLLGRNGAGKTTTFQMMIGLIKPDSGSILLDDQDISKYSTHQRAKAGVTYLPQENSVFLKTTVEKNLRMILELQKLSNKEQKNIRSHLLQELGLSLLAKQSAHSLSGGERRKLEISRSLILNPKFLLLDEPFTGIDPITISDIQNILIGLKERNIGIILSDHNVRDTLMITDTAYIINEGEILIKGTPQEIAASEIARKNFLGKNFKLGEELSPYSS